MPKFEVQRDTIDSATGRVYKAGEIWDMAELPIVVERDIEGRPVLDANGKPKSKPMTIGTNLKLIVEDESKAKK